LTRDVVIITGANRGIGRSVALALARSGASIVMACRDVRGALETAGMIKAESGNDHIEVQRLDLASFDSTRNFANGIKDRDLKVSTLINNAGVLCDAFRETADGYEMTMQVNYFGQFLLTLSLLPSLRDGGQIINTSSIMYRLGRADDGIFHRKPETYNRFRAYADSKLASLLFSLELAERVSAHGISVNSYDPGIVNTNIITMHNPVIDALSDVLFRPFIRTTQTGAGTCIYLALENDTLHYTGEYFVRGKARALAPKYLNNAYKRRLWEETETIVGTALSGAFDSGYDAL